MTRLIFDWPLVIESLRNKIKRIVSKIWNALLHQFYIFQREGLRFRFKRLSGFLFHDGSFTRCQTPISVTGHWRILSIVELMIFLEDSEQKKIPRQKLVVWPQLSWGFGVGVGSSTLWCAQPKTAFFLVAAPYLISCYDVFKPIWAWLWDNL